mgnify:CR=1 FL=1
MSLITTRQREGMKGLLQVLYGGLLLCIFMTCAGCGQSNKKDAKLDKISELEQMKYDNISQKLDLLCSKAQSAHTDLDLQAIYTELSQIEYDYNPNGMGERAQQKCQELKERLAVLQASPSSLLPSSQTAPTYTVASESTSFSGKGLISRRHMKVDAVKRYPYYFKAQDQLRISLTPHGSALVSLFDINHQKRLKQWHVQGTLEEQVTMPSDGIYMIELRPDGGELIADIALSYEGVDNDKRPRVSERTVSCKQGDFLAEATESVRVSPVFKEPKKVGLRGNLKSIFSGKSRALISVPVPAGSDAILYSLRISTNEKTAPSDGKFADNLSLASKQIKLLGIKVYEKRTISSSVIDRLLFNTRPAREEDAFCNMYVLTDATQAKKFQDETASSGHYKYDVEQSQMGTQSCNGELKPKGRKTIYLGFENERMRYDNYIWLEVASLAHTKEYSRPVYFIR